MNNSVYVFGSLGSTYTQYPDDYAKVIFQNFYTDPFANSQIVIHRNNNLMYYGYYRKLDENSKFIGFCVVLNGIVLTQIDKLFSIFEDAVANLVSRGVILQINDGGDLISDIKSLSEKKEEVERITSTIRNEVVTLENGAKKLPPVSYGVSINEKKYFTLDNKVEEIVESSHKYAYTYITKDENYDTETIRNFKVILHRINCEKEDLERECRELKSKNFNLQIKQRNTKWVGGLAVVVGILFVILYFKVINPSEVTNYKTDEFVYYGPIKNGKPHGVGVAIYPSNDKDKRKYYYGHFENGIRKDTAAMLYYQNGNYFYGEIENNHFVKGIQYVNSSNSYFRGSFDDDSKPYNGTWYDYEEAYNVVYGQ